MQLKALFEVMFDGKLSKLAMKTSYRSCFLSVVMLIVYADLLSNTMMLIGN